MMSDKLQLVDEMSDMLLACRHAINLISASSNEKTDKLKLIGHFPTGVVTGPYTSNRRC